MNLYGHDLRDAGTRNRGGQECLVAVCQKCGWRGVVRELNDRKRCSSLSNEKKDATSNKEVEIGNHCTTA